MTGSPTPVDAKQLAILGPATAAAQLLTAR